MQRYFVSVNHNDGISFTEQDIFHITKVMRMKINDEIEIVHDGQVDIFNIDSLSPFKGHVIRENISNSELEKEVTLFLPLLKSDKAELIIQKATEIGVKNIIFYLSKRSIIRLTQADFDKKLNRYLMIAKEASEQSHRNIVPSIFGVIDLSKIDEYMLDINILAYEALAGSTTSFASILDNNKSTSIIVGPEGGFEKSEVDLLVNKGFNAVSLGKRILRVETAAIFALSIIAFNLDK